MLTTARAKAAELGCVPVLPGAGATLRLLAAAAGARAVVEVGHRRRRRLGLPAARHAPRRRAHHHRRRARAPAGRPRDLRRGRHRLQPGPADLRAGPSTCSRGSPTRPTTWCSATPTRRSTPATSSRRCGCSSPGGLVVFDNALWHDRVADPTQRDEETTAIRELGSAVREDERLVSAMLASGDGLLAAVKRDPDGRLPQRFRRDGVSREQRCYRRA